MKILALLFFHGYVWTLIVFGALGVFTARLDYPILFHTQVNTQGSPSETSMVSQYRFFRAIECGFGTFAFLCRKEIFQQRLFNRIFLGTMFGGVLARGISFALDGQPYPAFYAFFWSELIGGILIYLYTRRTLARI